MDHGRGNHGGDAERASGLERGSQRDDAGVATFRVLVADADADLRAHVARVLAPYARVTAVDTAEAALATLESGDVDLLLTGTALPSRDDLALLRHVRASPALDLVPVILLAPGADEGARAWALAAGADDVLVKPLAGHDLVARIVSVLASAQARAATLAHEHVAATDAVRAGETRFRVVANVVPDLLWQSDRDGQATWYNDRWYDYTGHPREHVTGDGWMRAGHPDDRGRMWIAWSTATRSGRSFVREQRLRRRDGVYRWFLVRGEPLHDDLGRVLGWLGAATDMEEQRLAHDEVARRVTDRTAQLAEANTALAESVAALAETNTDLAESKAERDRLRLRLAKIEEEERRRLARELHDEVGQHLTALGLGLQSISDVVPPGSEVDRRAERLRDLVNTLGRELHAIAVRLRPKALDDFGLEAAIASYATEWSRLSGIAVDVHAELGPDRLPQQVEDAAYRVVQEALTNVARHAGAHRAGVVLERHDGHLHAIVEDDGRGFGANPADDDAHVGLGLLGIRERVALLEGSFEVESSAEHGTTLFARIPIVSDD